MEYSLAGTEFKFSGFFSLNTLNISFHYLIACMVSEKSDIIFIFDPL